MERQTENLSERKNEKEKEQAGRQVVRQERRQLGAQVRIISRHTHNHKLQKTILRPTKRTSELWICVCEASGAA